MSKPPRVRGKRGRKSTVPPEIYDLCLELAVAKSWGPTKIAEYLLEEKNIGRTTEDGERVPVCRQTVWHWQRKSAKTIVEEKVYREDFETVKANVSLDDIRARLYALEELYPARTYEEELKWIDRALAVHREIATTRGIYPEKRKRIVHEGEAPGIGPKDLDPQRESGVAAFERWLREGRDGSSTALDAS